MVLIVHGEGDLLNTDHIISGYEMSDDNVGVHVKMFMRDKHEHTFMGSLKEFFELVREAEASAEEKEIKRIELILEARGL